MVPCADLTLVGLALVGLTLVGLALVGLALVGLALEGIATPTAFVVPARWLMRRGTVTP